MFFPTSNIVQLQAIPPREPTFTSKVSHRGREQNKASICENNQHEGFIS
jgi:hypothetical protein